MNTLAGGLGVTIGTNIGGTGVFNLSGTGNLNMPPTSTMQIGRSDGNVVSNTTDTYAQTGGTATVGILRMGGAGATTSPGTTATLALSGGTFSAVTFNALSAGNTSVSTINISGTADVTLPAFPTLRGSASTATITFDGGTLRSAAASPAYMGGLTNAFIKAGGIDFAIGTGKDIAISQNLLTEPVSTGGGLTKSDIGTLPLSGTNTYTGATTINGGTLQLGNGTATGSLSTSSAISVGTGATFAINQSDTVAQGGDFSTSAINGLGGFLEAGTGTTVLNLANGFTGPTAVNAGAGSLLNFNTVAGGANATTSTLGTSLITLSGQTAGNAINPGFTVTDAGGFGLATVNVSDQVVRPLGGTLLPASGATSATDYLVDNNAGGSAADGSSSLIITASQSAKSITVDTTTASGNLTLDPGFVLSNNTWNFGGAGSNTDTGTTTTTTTTITAGQLTINDGSIAASSNIVNNAALEYKLNTTARTYANVISGTGILIKTGTNNLTLTGANTYSGGTNITGSGNEKRCGNKRHWQRRGQYRHRLNPCAGYHENRQHHGHDCQHLHRYRPIETPVLRQHQGPQHKPDGCKWLQWSYSTLQPRHHR